MTAFDELDVPSPVRSEDDCARALLGSIFLDAMDGHRDALEDALARVGPEDFRSHTLRAIWTAINVASSDGSVPHFDAVADALEGQFGKDRGSMDEVGAQMRSCVQSTHTPAHASHFARKLRDLAQRRRTVSSLQEILHAAQEGEDVAESLRSLVEQVESTGDGLSGHVSELTAAAMRELTTRTDLNAAGEKALGWGLSSLDNLGCYIRPGDFAVVAGPPKAGKTSWAIGCALRWATTRPRPVLVCSLEMPQVQVVKRLITGHAGVRDPGLARLAGEQEESAKRAAAWIDSSLLYVPKKVPRQIAAFDRWVRGVIRKDRPAAVVLDYLGLLRGRGESETTRVGDVSNVLRGIALDTNCPVIAIHTINRSSATERREPGMHDLRSSGQIEYDLTHAVFLWRPISLLTDAQRANTNIDPDAVKLKMDVCRHATPPGPVDMLLDKGRVVPVEKRSGFGPVGGG